MVDYAIVQTGGKQYQVQAGHTVRVESLPGDVGDKLELNDVLLISQNGSVTVGTPLITGAKVSAEVVGKGRGKKIVVFKYKAKTRYRKMAGHRQAYIELKVTDISINKRRASRRTPSGA